MFEVDLHNIIKLMTIYKRVHKVPLCWTILIASQLIELVKCENGNDGSDSNRDGGLGSGGFVYSTFSGPVSGEVEEISIPAYGHNSDHDAESPQTVEYVAKPDYTFSYGVEDPNTGNSQAHYERRQGDVVEGQYSLVEPDGSLRRVTYTADPKHGFRAKVEFIPPTGETDTNSIDLDNLHSNFTFDDTSANVENDADEYSPSPDDGIDNDGNDEENSDAGNVDYTSGHYAQEVDENPDEFGTNYGQGEPYNNEESYPIPSKKELDEINNMFDKYSDAYSHRIGGGGEGIDVGGSSQFFQNMKIEPIDRSLFDKLPPFPPLPDIDTIHNFGETEYTKKTSKNY